MKHSRQFAAVIGSLALAAAAFAQNTPPATPPATQPNTIPPVDSPSVTPSKVESAPAIPSNVEEPISTPASTTSTSTAPVSSTEPVSSTASSDVTTATNITVSPSQFKVLDADGDNRISRAEFTTSTQTQVSTTADGKPAKEEKKHWWSRKSDDKDALNAGLYTPEAFSQLDTDNDGFLSQAELAHSNNPRN